MINVIIFPIVFILLMITLYMIRKNLHKIIRPNMRRNLLFTYLSLLVVVTIVFLIVQPRIIILEKEVDEQLYVFDLLHETDDFTALEPYKVKEWDIVVEEETIRLQAMHRGYAPNMYIPVVVIEDKEKEKEARIVHYETKSSLNGVDISSYIDLPIIDVKDSHVVAKVSGQMDEHEFRSIQNDAILRQFQQKETEEAFFDLDLGELAIVMTVPTGTAVKADLEQFDVIRK